MKLCVCKACILPCLHKLLRTHNPNKQVGLIFDELLRASKGQKPWALRQKLTQDSLVIKARTFDSRGPSVFHRLGSSVNPFLSYHDGILIAVLLCMGEWLDETEGLLWQPRLPVLSHCDYTTWVSVLLALFYLATGAEVGRGPVHIRVQVFSTPCHVLPKWD